MNLHPGLYIVSTPIGNLQDITLRAIDVLTNSDIIFCEDSRTSSKLLDRHGINKPLKLYNDNSDSVQRTYIKNLIEQEKKIISLVSDAGTPLISDPGYKLVNELRNFGVKIDVIPGPCALITALTISGMPTDRFTFLGFLPKTIEGKTKVFSNFINLNSTIVLYENANRLLSTLEIAKKVLGDRESNLARELTKIYQESKSALLSELINYYKNHPVKGELVLSISGKSKILIDVDSITKEIQALLTEGNSAKLSSDIIFNKYKNQYSRKEIYKIANSLK